MMDILNYPTLRTLARVLLTVPAGAAVKGVIDRFHELESCVPDAGQMILQRIQYESYQALTADACAMVLCETADNDLTIALHGAEVLEEVREGTACDMPTGEAYEMSILTPELREKWYGEIASEEEMEALVFSAMKSVMAQTHNFPLALEVVQYLVAYRLAAAVWRLPGPVSPEGNRAHGQAGQIRHPLGAPALIRLHLQSWRRGVPAGRGDG